MDYQYSWKETRSSIFLHRNSFQGTITCVARCTQSCPELRKLVLDWFIGGLATLKIIQDEKVIKF